MRRDQSRVYSNTWGADHMNMERRGLYRSRTVATAVIGVVLLAGAGTVGPVSAATSALPSRTRTGTCTLSATWKLAVKRVDAGLKVTFTISGGAKGHRWTIFMDDNGTGFYARSRNASASGSLKVTKTIPDLRGKDRISAAASDRGTGETCSGRATI
jgi:hypothetical protein